MSATGSMISSTNPSAAAVSARRCSSRVRVSEPLALGLGVTREPQLATVDDSDRGLGAHDPELGLGPREHQVRAQVA